MKMRNGRSSGRASCWLIGGIGCLVLVALVVVASMILVRNLGGSKFFKEVQTSATRQEQVANRFERLVKAIKLYRQDHGGAYPPNLDALAPKYLGSADLQPLQLDQATRLRWVYKPPKPTDPPETIVLIHQPAAKFRMSLFGETFEQDHLYYLRKDGEIIVRQEIPLSKYKKSRGGP